MSSCVGVINDCASFDCPTSLFHYQIPPELFAQSHFPGETSFEQVLALLKHQIAKSGTINITPKFLFALSGVLKTDAQANVLPLILRAFRAWRLLTMEERRQMIENLELASELAALSNSRLSLNCKQEENPRRLRIRWIGRTSEQLLEAVVPSVCNSSLGGQLSSNQGSQPAISAQKTRLPSDTCCYRSGCSACRKPRNTLSDTAAPPFMNSGLGALPSNPPAGSRKSASPFESVAPGARLTVRGRILRLPVDENVAPAGKVPPTVTQAHFGALCAMKPHGTTNTRTTITFPDIAPTIGLVNCPQLLPAKHSCLSSRQLSSGIRSHSKPREISSKFELCKQPCISRSPSVSRHCQANPRSSTLGPPVLSASSFSYNSASVSAQENPMASSRSRKQTLPTRAVRKPQSLVYKP
jgi:hypothetical protein